jgi:hypothetical protein
MDRRLAPLLGVSYEKLHAIHTSGEARARSPVVLS